MDGFIDEYKKQKIICVEMKWLLVLPDLSNNNVECLLASGKSTMRSIERLTQPSKPCCNVL